MQYKRRFDVIVVGGGHAGTEAACAAARMGAQTLLLTHNMDTLGQMSCNPAIGGIGKGHLVKEIDAMGGIMAKAADFAGIQFRRLNASKGAAVRATRAQADRQLYRQAVHSALENQANLFIFQQAVTDLIIESEQVCGVQTEMGLDFRASTIVLTVGTFLAGKIHIGMESYPGGRAGDPPANKLAERLRDLDLNVARLKTGTPARLDARTLDFSKMKEQPGDNPIPSFSFMNTAAQHPRQLSCYITQTNQQTHDIIQEGLARSPLYTGKIEGVGPRYCPSIEDKIHRFADKSSHQIFVEPEGLNTHEIYPNGISTSLPFDIQERFIHSINGFENAWIIRPGYAIEYDFFDPRGLKNNLETKAVKGLFFAGQINGTTGYEEAAAQGLVAGINAALNTQQKDSWSPARNEAYIGVMIDDLITRGTAEPYRMFTSRAEYRLLLREDNADIRLTPKAYELGLIDEHRWQLFQQKQQAINETLQEISQLGMDAEKLSQYCSKQAIENVLKQPFSKYAKLNELLQRSEVEYTPLKKLYQDYLQQSGLEDKYNNSLQRDLTKAEIEQIEIQCKYAGYIKRQLDEIEKHQQFQQLSIPVGFDYLRVHGLSNEVREKLLQVKPQNIEQANRIPGVTPAAISLLLIALKKLGKTSHGS